MENEIIINKENTLLALNLWIWLFNNPRKRKTESPYWEDIECLKNQCPLCDFLRVNCINCPGFWNKKYFFRQRYISYKNAIEYDKLGELCFAGAYNKWCEKWEKKYSGFIASNIRRYAVKQGYLEKKMK